MKKRKSKKRDKAFIDLILKTIKKVSPYESKSNLMEQLIENILSEKEESNKYVGETREKLLEEFVDWNEIRLVSADRLDDFFAKLADGQYKRKVLQALLNKIFSRSGSLDYQFLMDFETEDLEDYLSGIMEMSEETRKRLLVRVFRKQILPITVEHEPIFESIGTTYVAGDDLMKETFSKLTPEELEGIKLLFDNILDEAKDDDNDIGDLEESKTLNAMVKQLDKVD